MCASVRTRRLCASDILGQQVTSDVSPHRSGIVYAVVNRPKRLGVATKIIAHHVKIDDTQTVFSQIEEIINGLRRVSERNCCSAACINWSYCHFSQFPTDKFNYNIGQSDNWPHSKIQLSICITHRTTEKQNHGSLLYPFQNRTSICPQVSQATPGPSGRRSLPKLPYRAQKSTRMC